MRAACWPWRVTGTWGHGQMQGDKREADKSWQWLGAEGRA